MSKTKPVNLTKEEIGLLYSAITRTDFDESWTSEQREKYITVVEKIENVKYSRWPIDNLSDKE